MARQLPKTNHYGLFQESSSVRGTKRADIGAMKWGMQGLKRNLTLLRDVSIVLTGSQTTPKCTVLFSCLKGTVEDKFACYRDHSKSIFGGLFLMLQIDQLTGGRLATLVVSGVRNPQDNNYWSGISMTCDDTNTPFQQSFEISDINVFSGAYQVSVIDCGYPEDPNALWGGPSPFNTMIHDC